jgi:hypothetical protein
MNSISTTAQRTPQIEARVLRIQSAGAVVKVELAGEKGEAFWAEITTRDSRSWV